MRRKDERRRGSRRVHHCERCNWSTRREAHASKRACPRCGGRVLLTVGRRERMARRRLKLSIPEDWYLRLGPRPLVEIRLAIAERIGVRYTPPGSTRQP